MKKIKEEFYNELKIGEVKVKDSSEIEIIINELDIKEDD